MNRIRAFVLGACVTLLGLAGVLVIAPEVLGPLDPMLARTFETWLANSELALVLLGLAIALVGTALARRTGPAATANPDLEAVLEGVDSTATGSDLDEHLGKLHEISAEDSSNLEEDIREEVHQTAATVLARTRNLTGSEARDRLRKGSWTTDPQAGAFFSRRPAPMSVRLREWLSADTGFERRLQRVLTELEAALDLQAERGSDADTGRSGEDGSESTALVERDEEVRHRVDRDASDQPTDDRVVETVGVTESADGESTVVAESVVTSRRFGLSVGLVAVAVGLITNVTSPFLLGFLAIGYSLTKYVSSPHRPEVEVTRVLGSDSPVPGDLVEVELTVENRGERPLPDIRVVDGVPAALQIVEGSPSMATSLQPDGSASLKYVFQAKRGTFTFEETQLATRDLTNVHERVTEVTVPTRLTGATRLEDVALHEQASQRIGAVNTDTGGSGVEFYGTREYREGDPLSSVNWNQLAKTGELTTVEFREQRAPTVSIVLDQRDAARKARARSALDAVDLSVYAAEQAFLTLLDIGTDVGLITYAERLTDIEPASDATQRALVQSRLRAATDRYAALLGESTVDTTGVIHQRLSPEPASLDHHVPRNAQVMLLSPATDDFALEATERLAALGHPVTLLSPDVVGADSPGGRHRRLDRTCRLQAIRDQGTLVIDWQPDEPVQVAIARATELVSAP